MLSVVYTHGCSVQAVCNSSPMSAAQGIAVHDGLLYSHLIARLQHLQSAGCHQLIVPQHQRSMFDLRPFLWPVQLPGTRYQTIFEIQHVLLTVFVCDLKTFLVLFYCHTQRIRLTSCNECWILPFMWSAVHTSLTAACRDSYTPNYSGLMYRSRLRSSSASWCSTVCTTKHPSTSLTSASLSPVSLPDNIFALSAEVFSSCLAIVSAVMVGGLFLWPDQRYGTGYQTVWEIRPSAETPSSVHWRHFYFQLTRVPSALELFGRCALQIYFTYLLTYDCTLYNYTIDTDIDVDRWSF